MGSYFAPHTKLTPSFTLAGCWLISIEQIDQHQRNGKSRFSSHQNGEKRERDKITLKKREERARGRGMHISLGPIGPRNARIQK